MLYLVLGKEIMNFENEDETKNHLKNIHKLKFLSGKSLIELSSYENIALWWFVNFDFLRFLKRTQNSSNNKKETKTVSVKFSLEKGLLPNVILLIYGLSISMFCKINIRLYNTKLKNKNSKILIVAQDIEWRRTWCESEKIFTKSDAFFDSTISLLKKNHPDCEIVTIYPVGNSVSGLKIIVDKRRSQKFIVHKSFESYFSYDIWKKRQKGAKYFSNLWDEIKKEAQFCALFECNAKQWSSIENKVSNYFNRTFGGIVQNIEMAKKMIDREKPDLILLQNEYSGFEMSLVVAGKLKGIPTLAVQHGAIYPLHGGYMHTKDEIASDGNIRSPYYPIPDKTALYGFYHKNLLIDEGNYPKNSVVVTGQPRYDIIFHADKIYNKSQFLKRFNIPQKNKIVLWTTTLHGNPDVINLQDIKVMFETFKNLNNITLIIKQHPGEGKKNTKMIQNALKKYNFNVILVPKNSDTYELIYMSDLMISKDSTTVMEAVAFNKPVIVFDLINNSYIVNYVKEGIALGVYGENDLRPAIEKLLADDLELAKNREKFISDYMYKIDGKSTERVVQLIEEMLNQK